MKLTKTYLAKIIKEVMEDISQNYYMDVEYQIDELDGMPKEEANKLKQDIFNEWKSVANIECKFGKSNYRHTYIIRCIGNRDELMKLINYFDNTVGLDPREINDLSNSIKPYKPTA